MNLKQGHKVSFYTKSKFEFDEQFPELISIGHFNRSITVGQIEDTNTMDLLQMLFKMFSVFAKKLK